MPKLKWYEIWEEFDAWVDKREDKKKCKSCGSYDHCFPEWEEQQEQIRKVVERHIKKLPRQ